MTTPGSKPLGPVRFVAHERLSSQRCRITSIVKTVAQTGQ